MAGVTSAFFLTFLSQSKELLTACVEILHEQLSAQVLVDSMGFGGWLRSLNAFKDEWYTPFPGTVIPTKPPVVY